MKGSKLTRALIIFLVLVIIGLGVTSLVFFLMNKSNTNKLNEMTAEKENCETQIAEQDRKIVELEATKINLQNALDEATKETFANFVYDYSKYSTDTIRVTEYIPNEMGISAQRRLDGNIEMCVFDGSFIPNFTGTASRDYKQVDGLFGKVSQVYIYSIGQSYNPQVLFLLEDGKVQFLDTAKLAQGQFVIGGTLDADKVIKVMQVNVNYSGGSGHVAIATVDKTGNVKVFNELK